MNLCKEYAGKNHLLASDGASGDWSVKTFTISEKEAFRLAAGHIMNLHKLPPYLSNLCTPGTYKKLMHGPQAVMSNTPEELRTCQIAIDKARGDILITGLGLGIVPHCLLRRRNVGTITIIEKSQEVIDLVGPSLKSSRLRIICDDAWTYKPDRKFDFAWHDIWTDPPKLKDVPRIEKLLKRYEPFCKEQDYWLRYELETFGEPRGGED